MAMYYKKVIISSIFALCVLGSPVPALAASTDNQEQLRQSLIQTVALLQQQLELLLAQQLATVSISSRVAPSEISNIQAQYNVRQGSLVRRGGGSVMNDHQAYWEVVQDIIPVSWINQHIGEFLIYNDVNDDADAFVETLYAGKNTLWRLGINVGTEDNTIGDRADQDLLIHEFGHIVSLNTAQISPNTSSRSCNTYYSVEGCPKNGSYFQTFVDRFWDDDLLEASLEAEESDNPQEAVEDYWQQREDEFVTDYAASNPGEDWAETFVFFVTEDKPAGSSVADQKVRSLYAFSDLVTLRTTIRNSIDL